VRKRYFANDSLLHLQIDTLLRMMRCMTKEIVVLKDKKLKVTPARVAVLEVLKLAQKPFPVQKIVEKLGKEAINFSTVYRTLITLEKSGLIQKVQISSSQAFYELAHTTSHHHLVCTQCEDVEEVDIQDGELQTTILKKSKLFSKVQTKTVELFGICNSCEK